MSSASNVKPQSPPLDATPVGVPDEKAAVKPAAAASSSKARFPRVNSAIDATISALSLVGLGFLKPIVAISRGEDPRAHMRQLWLDLGAPIIAIAAFLLVW
ncbi:MAG TPA: hypothetical protein VFS58_11040, partial [Steroidobacteraceae bacterium]|nr:hypothetical protein [Steroidobacteraceae bacterium]